MTKQKHIGILGGTFDPIHIGHLFIAEAVREEIGLDRVLFIPTGDPPHKKRQLITPGRHRVNMIKLAIQDSPFFNLDTLEMDRSGTTYTVDTLKQLKTIYPFDYNFSFIIGGDTLLDLKTWIKLEEVVRLCNFIVYRRPDSDNAEVDCEAQRLSRELQASFYFVEGPRLDIASREIRDRVASNKTIKHLVPEQVDKYIREFHLYLGGESVV